MHSKLMRKLVMYNYKLYNSTRYLMINAPPPPPSPHTHIHTLL